MGPKLFAYVDKKGRPLTVTILQLLFGCLAFINLDTNGGGNIFNWLLALSGLSSFFGGGATPQRSPSPAPELPIRSHSLEQEEADETRRLLQVNTTGVVLTVFSADVDVTLDERMRKELLRATKKNAPQRMKYELIYVRMTRDSKWIGSRY